MDKTVYLVVISKKPIDQCSIERISRVSKSIGAMKVVYPNEVLSRSITRSLKHFDQITGSKVIKNNSILIWEELEDYQIRWIFDNSNFLKSFAKLLCLENGLIVEATDIVRKNLE